MISIGYITARKEARFDWFFQSLVLQLKPGDDIQIILCDFFAQSCDDWTKEDCFAREVDVFMAAKAVGLDQFTTWAPPKPTVWAGPHRITKHNWWNAANCRNTVLCLAQGDYWVNVDDRCVLQPQWMEAVREAVKGKYSVCGPYQKRTGITVESGVIRHAGIVTGEDNRLEYVREHYSDPRHQMTNPYSAPGTWYYGCSFGVPMEWALRVNGFPEDICDGLGSEDSMFGLLLQNNRMPIYFDERMLIIEDRTPEFLGTPMRREDKGEIGTARDKSHACLAKFQQSKTSLNSFDIRRVRESVLSGKPFPTPSALPYDWYDNQPLSKF